MRIIKNAIQKIPWIKESDMDVDKRIVEYLKEHNQEYMDLGKEVDKILDDYPILSQLLDKENAITLTEEQHKAYRKYIFLKEDMENLERSGRYLMGQADMIPYMIVMSQIERKLEKDNGNYKELKKTQKEFYSLDCNDVIENAAIGWAQPSPEDHLIEKEELAEYEELIRRLYEAISSLPPMQARRVHARYMLGMKVKDTAAMEGITPSQAGKSIHAALRRLRRYFACRKWTVNL